MQFVSPPGAIRALGAGVIILDNYMFDVHIYHVYIYIYV